MWGRENDSIINRDRSEGKAGMGRKAIILKKGKKGRWEGEGEREQELRR